MRPIPELRAEALAGLAVGATLDALTLQRAAILRNLAPAIQAVVAELESVEAARTPLLADLQRGAAAERELAHGGERDIALGQALDARSATEAEAATSAAEALGALAARLRLAAHPKVAERTEAIDANILAALTKVERPLVARS